MPERQRLTPPPPPRQSFGDEPPAIVVVTGMSGAGRSTALNALEDLGYYCVDNLPAALVPTLLELLAHSKLDEQPLRRIGFGIDVRTGAFLDGAGRVLDELAAAGYAVQVVFLDCADEVLLRRYSESRRPHPLAPEGDVLEAIQREREHVAPLRARARVIFDTGRWTVHELRQQLVEHLVKGGEGAPMVTRLVSFGFKYGLPIDADLVFDVRYLPNPHFVPALRPLTGTDPNVSQFVLQSPEGDQLLQELQALLTGLLPRYAREGKAYLTVAIGCTGGKHRSVALAEALAQALQGRSPVRVVHRDIARA